MTFNVSFSNSYNGKTIKVAYLVPQGSAATQVMCCEKRDDGCIDNL